jgi:hypothetical protein
MNNGQQAFRRLVVQLRSSGGGRGGGPSGKGMFAGGGLLAALVGGGVLVNASLFNGEPSFTERPHSARYGSSVFEMTVLTESSPCSVDGGHRAIKYSR